MHKHIISLLSGIWPLTFLPISLILIARLGQNKKSKQKQKEKNMWKKLFAVSVAAIGAVAVFCNGNAFASYTSEPYTPGEKKNFYSGDIDVCVTKTGGYTGDTIIANVSDGHFDTQLSFDSFSENEKCKSLTIPSSGDTNYVSYYTPMGLGNLNLDKESLGTTRKIKLNLSNSTKLSKYLGSNGSFDNRIGASKIEIQFDANGGEGTMPEMTNLDPNTSFTLDSNSLTRTDYRFNGWNTKADGTGTSYADGETISLNKGGIVRLYAQWVQTVATLNTGGSFNAKLKKLAGDASATSYTADTNIKKIVEASSLPAGFDTENDDYIISASDSPVKMYAWFDNADNDNDGVSDGVIYWYSDADTIYVDRDSSRMFRGMQALTSLTLPDSFDTSNVTDMSQMFYDVSALTSLTLPESFNTANVKNMNNMFGGMEALTSLTLPSTFDTSNVTNMSSMFIATYALTSLTLPNSFNTSKVTNMNYMFGGMRALTSLTLPDSFDTSNVTDMGEMFYDMRALTSLALPDSFNTSKVTDMSNMFSSMLSLTSLTLPDSFNTSNVTNMSSMFGSAYALTSLTLPNTFNTSNVTNMRGMFCGMHTLTSLTLPSAFDTTNVTNMSYMFCQMYALTSLTFSGSFNTANVTDMSWMFYETTSLASLTLPDSFDTSKVTDMSRMFRDMQALTSLTLPDSFDTSNVTDMNSMFSGMRALASLTLPDSFDTSKVTDTGYMFSSMRALTSLTLPDSFVIASGTITTNIFSFIKNTATLYATDATARSLWPGVLGN